MIDPWECELLIFFVQKRYAPKTMRIIMLPAITGNRYWKRFPIFKEEADPSSKGIDKE